MEEEIYKSKADTLTDIRQHLANIKPEECGCTCCIVRLILENNLVNKS